MSWGCLSEVKEYSFELNWSLWVRVHTCSCVSELSYKITRWWKLLTMQSAQSLMMLLFTVKRPQPPPNSRQPIRPHMNPNAKKSQRKVKCFVALYLLYSSVLCCSCYDVNNTVWNMYSVVDESAGGSCSICMNEKFFIQWCVPLLSPLQSLAVTTSC